MLSVLAIIVTAFASVFFASRRSLRYLRYLQQDEYAPKRFIDWFRRNRAFDTRGSVVVALCIMLNLWLRSQVAAFLVTIAAALALWWVIRQEPDPRRSGKIRLVLTLRATRIWRLSLALYAVLIGLSLLAVGFMPFQSRVASFWLLQLLLFQLIPGCLLLAVELLRPGEERRQRNYMREANAIMTNVNPLVIGITGSYGKSSTKEMLGELLQTSLGPTFWPPKGINTLMGVTREIRERLRPAYRYAVVEMAAYRRGSIQRMCELTPPKAGIITAIGAMHLERFKSRENIYRAKTELVRAIPDDGILVCNGDDPGARRAAEEFRKQTTLLYGFDTTAHLDCAMSGISFDLQGSKFTLNWKGQQYSGTTKLLGKPALSNIMASFSVACALGAAPELVPAAIGNLEPLENRLSLARSNGLIRLNDAYNSNPIGFRAALEVLDEIPGKQKILMTPGMIEIGDEQHDENLSIGEFAAKRCDYALVVGSTNREALRSGLRSGGLADERIVLCSDREDAFSVLSSIASGDDVVLVENDLPDLYERAPVF